MISKDNLHKELSVGQLAQRSGVAVTALHFYESKGLIHSSRNPGNQRRYPREVLRRVALIKVAQRLGIPWRKSARPSSPCLTIARPPRQTGNCCRKNGATTSMNGSAN